MSEQGRVKIVPGKKFVFIEPGHVFQHLSELPPGVRLGEGDVVEYASEAGEKGLRAVKGSLKLISKAEAGATPVTTPPAASTERAEPDRTIPQSAHALRVSWGFGRITDDNLLPVEVFLKYGMDPALDQPVQLLVNARKFRKPVHPDENGSVVFLVPVPENASHLAFHAEVGGKLYSRVWQKEGSFLDTTSDEPPAAEPVVEPPPVKPLVEKLGHRQGIYTFRVTANPNKDVTWDGIAVRVRTPPCDDPDSNWGTPEAKTDDVGELLLQLEVKDDGAYGDVHFCSQGLRSDPEFVAHRNPPKRQKDKNRPASKAPTT